MDAGDMHGPGGSVECASSPPGDSFLVIEETKGVR
jgi:hypothetical protein